MIYYFPGNKIQYRRCILSVCFLLLTLRVTAPVYNSAYIIVTYPVRPYDRILNAVLMVESAGDTLAFNLSEEAVGGLQIRPIRLRDYNQRTGKDYKIEECYNFRISKEIFLYYAELYGYNDPESIARNWNGSGIATFHYWNKVRLLL
jgi:hypothetical protein